MRRFRRRKRFSFLVPFLLIILLGVGVVFGMQLWNSFWEGKKGDAVFYLVEGRAKILPYGNKEYENLYNGVRIKLGDAIKVMNGGKGVIRFYDGTVARLDQDSEVILEDITKNDADQQILLRHNAGNLWVNKPRKSGVIRKTGFVINTNFAAYSITGTVFNLFKNTNQEILSVINGEVAIDILENNNGKMRAITQETVGIGQQAVLDEAVMKAFYERQNPSIKKAIDATFNTTPWFIWNTEEDENPTDYSNPMATRPKPTPIIDTPATPDVQDGNATEVNTDKPSEPDEVNNESNEISKPELISIGGVPYQAGMIVSKDNIALSGKITNADALFVDEYKLTKFQAGSTTWTYNLSTKIGNLKPGKNQLEVYGTTEGGKKSPVLMIEFTYQPNTKPITEKVSTGNSRVN